MKGGALFRLIRFDKPIGTLLLWYPTAWALWLANTAQPSGVLVGLLGLGTFLMRSAGCVFNDITDRHIDQHVQRTAQRPIASGQVSLISAFSVLGLLLLAACLVLMQLPPACFQYALIALLISGIYPFTKRWLSAPQLILGLAFSMGIPIAYVASHRAFTATTGLLFLLNFFWIMAYDTVYALPDRDDDQRIGVHSTALLYGKQARLVVMLCSLISHSIWLIIAWLNGFSNLFLGLWCLAAGVVGYQMHALTQTQYLTQTQIIFLSNGLYGLILWIAVILK